MVLLQVNPETDDLDMVITCALQSETARDQVDRITRDGPDRQPEGENQRPKREWTRFKNRTGGSKNFKPGTTERPPPNRTDRVRVNAVSPQNAPEHRPRAGPSNQNRIPRVKLDELRAAGKCFNCRETGHEQQNCPKLNLMRPPRPFIKSGSICLAKLDKLAECKERADVYVGNVTITEPDPITDKIRRHEEIALQVHRLCEDAWGADPLWYIEETCPDCRFSVEANDEEITVWDFMNKRDRTFDRNDIEKPGFNIAEIFANPEPNTLGLRGDVLTQYIASTLLVLGR
jgi:hypothetical protein